MQMLPSSSANPKFYELNKQESLMENLKGQISIIYTNVHFTLCINWVYANIIEQEKPLLNIQHFTLAHETVLKVYILY